MIFDVPCSVEHRRLDFLVVIFGVYFVLYIIIELGTDGSVTTSVSAMYRRYEVTAESCYNITNLY